MDGKWAVRRPRQRIMGSLGLRQVPGRMRRWCRVVCRSASADVLTHVKPISMAAAPPASDVGRAETRAAEVGR